MLHELAEADGLYQSDVIRLLIRRTHVARFKKAKKKASKSTVKVQPAKNAKAKAKSSTRSKR